MSEKNKVQQRFHSFADIPRDAVAVVTPKPEIKNWVNWDATGMAITVLGDATITLQQWLTARLAELNRARVPMEDVSVVHMGGRTVIRVAGKPRFEFKIKCTMGTL